MNISLTQSAADKIKELMLEEDSSKFLRVFVQGGGCAGYSYGVTFEDVANEDDFQVDQHGIIVLVDAASAMYLEAANVDFVEDLTGSMFKINNPSAVTTCGCGSSFSV